MRTFEENKFLRSCMYKEGGIKHFKFVAQLFCDKFCFRHYRNRHKFCRLVAVCQRICNTFEGCLSKSYYVILYSFLEEAFFRLLRSEFA